MTLLSVSNLNISFRSRQGLTRAVSDFGFELQRGQTLGIVGESGSGKSVACHSLLQLLPQPPAIVESGRALFMGEDLLAMRERDIRRVRGNRIAMIFQDPQSCLNPWLRIGEQMCETLVLHKRIGKRQAIQRCAAALEEVGIDHVDTRLRQYPHEFSGGMQQRVMIAMALLTGPDIIIADEPTTALDSTVQAQILQLVKRIQDEHNIGLVFISHDLNVVNSVANQVLVMRRGETIEQGPATAVFQHSDHHYTRQLVDSAPRSAKPVKYRFTPSQQPPCLQVEQITLSYPSPAGGNVFANSKRQQVLQNINLSLHTGEVVGLVGESGSGKSTLSKCIVRLAREDSGSIEYNGQAIQQLDDKALKPLRREIQMVFQNPFASLDPRMTLYDTLAEPLRLFRLCPPKQLQRRIGRLLDEVGLPQSAAYRYPHEFSGGQCQRIAIARALAAEPQLLIADEPVSALDVTVQAQILQLLLELVAGRNLAMLFISHDLSVVRYMADRVLVMHRGSIIEQGDTETVFNKPQQPYTQLLLQSSLDPMQEQPQT